MQQTYFTPAEAADYTGLSSSYLAKLRMGASRTAGPKFVKIGIRAVLYRREDLDAWIETNLVNTVSS